MGAGAFVMINLSKRGREKRDFTSPPQCAIIRNRGAKWGKSFEKFGLSQVVITACAVAMSFRSRGVISRDPSLCQWNLPERRRCNPLGKNEAKSSRPAHTTRFGRCMRAQSTIVERSLLSFAIY